MGRSGGLARSEPAFLRILPFASSRGNMSSVAIRREKERFQLPSIPLHLGLHDLCDLIERGDMLNWDWPPPWLLPWATPSFIHSFIQGCRQERIKVVKLFCRQGEDNASEAAGRHVPSRSSLQIYRNATTLFSWIDYFSVITMFLFASSTGTLLFTSLKLHAIAWKMQLRWDP